MISKRNNRFLRKTMEHSDGMENNPLYGLSGMRCQEIMMPVLGRLADFLGASWIMEADIEKSSDMLLMIVTKDDKMIQLELRPN